MKNRYHEHKIFYFLITTIVIIQFVGFLIQLFTNHNIARNTLKDELTLGSKIFDQILTKQDAQLHQVTEVLAKDYGFREAIATSDKITLESTLDNLGNRANASLLLLMDTTNNILANVSKDNLSKHDINKLVASQYSSKAWLQIINRKLFHVVNTPVKAPNTIANLIIGYELDEIFVHEIRNQINMDFFFISKTNNDWDAFSSSLPSSETTLFINLYKEQLKLKNTDLFNVETNKYLMYPVDIKTPYNNSHLIKVVLAKELDIAMQPYKKSENMIIYLLLATVSFTALAVYLINKKLVKPLNELAHIDKLTGLGNRALLEIDFKEAIYYFKKSDISFALLVMDLNDFKAINDTHGHEAGDYVLKEISKRLKEITRTNDSLARLGGDEFVAILHNCSEVDAANVINKIKASIEKPINHKKVKLIIKMSIGMAAAPNDGDSMEQLLKVADNRMYLNKSKK